MEGTILDDFECTITPGIDGVTISWACLPGYEYQVQSSTSLDPESFTVLSPADTYEGTTARFLDTEGAETRRFYRVVRTAP